MIRSNLQLESLAEELEDNFELAESLRKIATDLDAMDMRAAAYYLIESAINLEASQQLIIAMLIKIKTLDKNITHEKNPADTDENDSLEKMDLSARASKGLKIMGVRKISDLKIISKRMLKEFRGTGMGEKTCKEIIDEAEKHDIYMAVSLPTDNYRVPINEKS